MKPRTTSLQAQACAVILYPTLLLCGLQSTMPEASPAVLHCCKHAAQILHQDSWVPCRLGKHEKIPGLSIHVCFPGYCHERVRQKALRTTADPEVSLSHAFMCARARREELQWPMVEEVGKRRAALHPFLFPHMAHPSYLHPHFLLQSMQNKSQATAKLPAQTKNAF